MIFLIFCCTFFYIVVASCLLHNANVDACCGVKCVAVYMVRCPVDEKLIAKFQGSWDQGTSIYETVPLMFCCVYDQVSCGWEADCQVPGQLVTGNIHVRACSSNVLLCIWSGAPWMRSWLPSSRAAGPREHPCMRLCSTPTWKHSGRNQAAWTLHCTVYIPCSVHTV